MVGGARRFDADAQDGSWEEFESKDLENLLSASLKIGMNKISFCKKMSNKILTLTNLFVVN